MSPRTSTLSTHSLKLHTSLVHSVTQGRQQNQTDSTDKVPQIGRQLTKIRFHFQGSSNSPSHWCMVRANPRPCAWSNSFRADSPTRMVWSWYPIICLMNAKKLVTREPKHSLMCRTKRLCQSFSRPFKRPKTWYRAYPSTCRHTETSQISQISWIWSRVNTWLESMSQGRHTGLTSLQTSHTKPPRMSRNRHHKVSYCTYEMCT